MADDEQKQNSFLRNITGIVISVIVLTCIFFGGAALLTLLFAIILIASKEYVQILRMKGFHPSFSVMALMCIIFCTIAAINRLDLLQAAIVSGTIASFLIVLFMGRQPYIANVATTALGFIYAAFLPCHIILIRQIGINLTKDNLLLYGLSEGFFLTMFAFLCITVTDIAAYYVGKRHGVHKLSSVISPKKTVEGAIGGGVFAILVSTLGIFYTNMNLQECILGGFLITVAAQLGDLSESLIKRDAGVKDSSNFLPGHGGFLDRCDSYVFALPVAYYYFMNCTRNNEFMDNIVKSLANVNF